MWNSVENPMVVDRYWADKEQEPKVIATCAGCEEDILEGQDIYEFAEGSVHNNSECCEQYVQAISMMKVAGE